MAIKSVEELALLSLIEHQRVSTTEPIFVAVDGRSGSGKSTLAAFVANAAVQLLTNVHSVVIIEGDDFYTGGSLNLWSSRPTKDSAQCAIDWQRQRSVISALKARGFAKWKSFDWHSKDWDSDRVPYCSESSECIAASLVLMEGVYSARKELQDLFDLRVLLDVPNDVRQAQIAAREGTNRNNAWERVWTTAEHQYFECQLDCSALDLVLK